MTRAILQNAGPASRRSRARGRRRAWRAGIVSAALAVSLLAGTVTTARASGDETDAAGAGASTVAPASPSPSAAPTPTWRLTSYRRIGYDKSFKADLIDELPAAPELVVFGGSRATRFEPSFITAKTGLSAFNCAVQCFRPEDAWAFSSYLYSRAPDVRLRCVVALQARTFNDDTMRGGLLYDKRLSSAFSQRLVERQKVRLGRPPVKELLRVSRFEARGFLRRNAYDITRERPGYSFSRHLDTYIRRLLPNHRWARRLRTARSRTCFERTMRLYNQHDVVPLVLIMPYHPKALRAFRAAGFQKHLDGLAAYLRDARTRCRFRVLDLVDIRTFGGSPTGFYDGAHVTRTNTRRIIRYAVAAAPECFR